DDLRIDGRVGRLVGRLDSNHLGLVAQPVLYALQVILAEIVVLVEHADLAVGLGLQDVGGIDVPFALVVRLPADRPGVVFGVVPFGGAGRDEQLRHLLLVHVVPDGAVGRGAERAFDQQHAVLLDQLARLLDGFRRGVGVVVGNEIDLAPVDAALFVDQLVVGGLRLADRAVRRGRPAIGHGVADLDLAVGDAGAVFLCAGG